MVLILLVAAAGAVWYFWPNIEAYVSKYLPPKQ